MKLLWTLDTEFSHFNCDGHNFIIDDGDSVFIPYSGTKDSKKIKIEYIQIDKNTYKPVSDASRRVETFDVVPHIFYEDKNYVFGNRIIKSKENSGRIIECLEDGKVIWQFKHWAYLYTDILEKNGCAIFGTDGMGGRLYCLDVNTGKIISETKTHFSGLYEYNGFNWHNGNLVLYGKGTLAVLNPFSGEIIDEYKIPSKYLYRSFLQVIDGYAYCCVLTDHNQSTVFCFEL